MTYKLPHTTWLYNIGMLETMSFKLMMDKRIYWHEEKRSVNKRYTYSYDNSSVPTYIRERAYPI